MRSLPEPAPSDLAAWKDRLARQKAKEEASFAYLIRSAGWGRAGSEKIAKLYSEPQLGELDDATLLIRVGFALYDTERYEEALRIFRKLFDQAGQDALSQGVALVWQGHLLDLLGRRDEAVQTYQKAVDLKVSGHVQHAQYNMMYSPSSYAAERIKEPFRRIENTADGAAADPLRKHGATDKP